MTGLPDGYYAVLSPDDPAVMTYWRVVNDRIAPWPARARYGPQFYRRDSPSRSDQAAYRAHIEQCFAVLREWNGRVRAALEVDPVAARARFAALTTCCCVCGRGLVDAASKTSGIGPDCRRGMPGHVLDAIAGAVARAHAAAVAGGA
jgi:hypothetical protein